MSAPPFLIFAHLRPTTASEKVWTEWYEKFCLPRLVETKIAPRATLYCEIPSPGLPLPNYEDDFLVLAQTERVDGHSNPTIDAPSKSSDILLQAAAGADMKQNHYSEVREYSLIQDYYPDTNHDAHFLTIEMQPRDEVGFDKWYREEHIPLLSKVPGYHRSTRYLRKPDQGFPGEKASPAYLALHEVRQRECMGSQEAGKANTTAWTVKQSKASEETVARAWKKVISITR